jgi:hypothetical protein
MNILRRDFLKICAGAAAAMGFEFSVQLCLEKVLASEGNIHVPTYPISPHVYTTLDRTIEIVAPPLPYPEKILLPCQVSRYAQERYGRW